VSDGPDGVASALPGDALVLLIGPSGSGKSTFASRTFAPSAVLSSDAFRALVADDPSDQAATADAFRVLHAVARARLRRGLLTVVDATNLLAGSRRPLLRLAAASGRPVVALLFETDLETCLRWNASRPDRSVPERVVRQHHGQLREARRQLTGEGILSVVSLTRDDLTAPRATTAPWPNRARYDSADP
jgi:predicted kinase